MPIKVHCVTAFSLQPPNLNLLLGDTGNMIETTWQNINMLALSSTQPLLSVKLGKIKPSSKLQLTYSRSKLPVPKILKDGRSFTLHSTFDPLKEGERYYSSSPHGGYLLFLGFGAGYHIQPFLKRSDISGIVIIDYGADLFKSLISQLDMRHFILDKRVRFLIDPQPEDIVKDMLDNYLPAVSGNLYLHQLRSRIELDDKKFSEAREKITEVLKSISEDYSVQSYFGKRWFINSIENLKIAENSSTTLNPIRTALITAAGPSLESQLPELKRQKPSSTLIATDTSLPFLLKHDLLPDMVISIDCQHITYHHFLSGYPEKIPLILDLASPNHLTRRTDRLVFFTSGHPFSKYVNTVWRKFPYIDTSGGNVSHAAVSLAESLGAQSIYLYGTDFSFPEGKTYARGTYLYPYFHSISGRRSSLENRFFSFLLRNENIIKVKEDGYLRYTTKPMISYKERLEESTARLSSRVIPMPGKGEHINVFNDNKRKDNSPIIGTVFSAGIPARPWNDFLHTYRDTLLGLPKAGESLSDYRSKLTKEQKDIVTTLFPAAAAIRRELEAHGIKKVGINILKEVIEWSTEVIDTQLSLFE